MIKISKLLQQEYKKSYCMKLEMEIKDFKGKISPCSCSDSACHKINLEFICPVCSLKLFFINNSDLEGNAELIPACKKCKKAFRNKSYGWIPAKYLD